MRATRRSERDARNAMKMNVTISRHVWFAICLGALTGCGAMIVPMDGGPDGDFTDHPPIPNDASDARDAAWVPDADLPPPDSGVVCRAPDGTILQPGQSYSQGCDLCYCQSDGTIFCTTGDCTDVVEDVPPTRTCTSSAECGVGEFCNGPAGCGVAWTCQPVTGCTADYAAFCSCRGETVYGSSSCPPEPYEHFGPCEYPDAGDVGPMCEGAFLDAMGNCLGPADNPLPPECCGIVDAGVVDAGTTGVDCNPHHVVCDALPPPCPSGEVRSVNGSCWGECVAWDACGPIPCDPSGPMYQCPMGLTCWSGTNECGPFMR
jgi:hypothetical protein